MNRIPLFAAALGALFPATLLLAAPAGAAPARAAQAGQAVPAIPSAPDPEKLKAIRTLLDLSGTARSAALSLDAAFKSEANSHPEIPAEFWTRFKARVQMDKIIDLIVPVYDKHFTKSEIDQLIAFYQTPVGKKMVAEQPVMMQEAMQACGRYGQEVATQIARELQQEEKSDKPKQP